MFYIGLYREKHEKIFLSETIRPRALIFDMRHHLIDFYGVCSNYPPGAKNGPLGPKMASPRGSPVLHRLI